jgi:hypothetical protein
MADDGEVLRQRCCFVEGWLDVTTRKVGVLSAFGLIWALTLGANLWRVEQVENTPGAASSARGWSADAALKLATDHDTLVMFVHPQCPCTDASVQELAEVMTNCRGQLAAAVVFFRPTRESDGWAKTRSWEAARAIPGVETLIDPGGALARQFDAKTSGQVFVYEPSGRLLFSGGITDSRGMAGDNAGASAIVELVRGEPKAFAELPVRTRVFGCAILEESTTRQ